MVLWVSRVVEYGIDRGCGIKLSYWICISLEVGYRRLVYCV